MRLESYGVPYRSIIETDAIMKYTSEVRYVCPETGVYLSEKSKLPESVYSGVIEALLYYKGTDTFMRSLSIQCRKGKALTEDQILAASRSLKQGKEKVCKHL